MKTISTNLLIAVMMLIAVFFLVGAAIVTFIQAQWLIGGLIAGIALFASVFFIFILTKIGDN